MKAAKRLLAAEGGAALTEYALLLLLIALACFVAASALGVGVSAIFANGQLQVALSP